MAGLILSWSGGKDSAWALEQLRREGREVSLLFTTFARGLDGVTGHGVRRSLIRQQAAAAGLPLAEVDLPWPCSDAVYQFAWTEAVAGLRDRDQVAGVAFGDLFLADIRAWRERLVAATGLPAVFPLWGMRPDLLADAMLAGGLAARICGLDPARVDRRWAGAAWDPHFLAALGPGVDPCGERGEFHTFVTAGPMLGSRVEVEVAAVQERDGLVYADLVPAGLRIELSGRPASPCRNVCRVGDDGLCDGCGRSLEEIGSWLALSDAGRQAVIARVRDWQPRAGGQGPPSPAPSGQRQPRSS